jgi:purine-nucleoside phosphorylase
MSTVPEVLVARHAGMRVLAFSVVSNVCLPDALGPVTAAEIVATARESERKLRQIVLGVLNEVARCGTAS